MSEYIVRGEVSYTWEYYLDAKDARQARRRAVKALKAGAVELEAPDVEVIEAERQ